jgi:hypothetical protein
MQDEESPGLSPGHLQQQLTRRLSGWLDRRQPPETVVLMGTALLVGLGAGLGAIVFRWLIDQVKNIRKNPLQLLGLIRRSDIVALTAPDCARQLLKMFQPSEPVSSTTPSSE